MLRWVAQATWEAWQSVAEAAQAAEANPPKTRTGS